jgi:hypothetical protein
VKWTGTVISTSIPTKGAPTVDTYMLTSDCVDGWKQTILISATAGGYGVGLSETVSKAEFDDGFSYLNPMAFVGPYVKTSAGIALGPIGVAYSKTQLGIAHTSGIDAEKGIDFSAGVVWGISNLMSQTKRVPCDCTPASR